MITLLFPSIVFNAKSTKIINCWIVNGWKDESLRIVGKTVVEYFFDKSHKIIQTGQTNLIQEIVFKRQILNTYGYYVCVWYPREVIDCAIIATFTTFNLW